MKLNNQEPGTNPLSMKRKEDLTVEELKGLPLFAQYSEEQLTVLLETAKRFTNILFPITRKQAKLEQINKVIDIIPHHKKKAA